jgi:hypothetical protein
LGRERPEDEDAAACEVAVDTLMFLADECEDRDCEPGPAAHLAILDLAAALLAFGGVRDVDKLAQWLREEVPARARELAKAVAASEKFDEVPPCSCLGTPEPAPWH